MIGSFFAEFDDHKGPIVVFDEPPGILVDADGRRLWESFSDYVLSGNPLLDGRIIQVRAGSASVVCLPVVLLDDEKYRRNAMLFSVGVTVPSEALEACAALCRATLLRVGRALRSMELESSVLSRGREEKDDTIRRKRLKRVIPLALKTLARLATRAACGNAIESLLDTDTDDAVTEYLVSDEEKEDNDDDTDANLSSDDDKEDPNIISLHWTKAITALASSGDRGIRNYTVSSPRFSVNNDQDINTNNDLHQYNNQHHERSVQHWEVPVLLARPRELLNVGTVPNASTRHNFSRDHPGRGDDAWDLAVQQVIPGVDGIRNVRQVAQHAHVDVDVAAQALRVLKCYGCLTLIDTFQYSNIYRATARTGDLISTTGALDACVSFVLRIPQSELELELSKEIQQSSRHSRSSDNLSSGTVDEETSRTYQCNEEDHTSNEDFLNNDAVSPQPTPHRATKNHAVSPTKTRRLRRHTQRQLSGSGEHESATVRIFRLFCAFADGRSVSDVLLSCHSNVLIKYLDHRAFAAYGTLHGLLVRVHRYPTAIDPLRNNQRPVIGSSPRNLKSTSTSTTRSKLGRALEIMDGNHCMDQICTELELSVSQLEELVKGAGYEIRDIYR